jgi:hypothetical protein
MGSGGSCQAGAAKQGFCALTKSEDFAKLEQNRNRKIG